jgi:hypothetical protein
MTASVVGTPPWRDAAWRVGFLGLCVAILYARKPDMFHRPQLVAEDGTIFFAQALTLGPAAFVTPYAGYLLEIQRVVAALAAAFAPVAAPAIYVGATVALTLWGVARTLSPRFPLRSRAVAGLAVVLVPDAGDVLLILSSVQWIFAVGLVALLVSRDPQTPRQKANDAITALVFSTTGPFGALLAGLFVWRAWVRRSRWSAILAAIVASAGLAQLVFLIAFSMGAPDAPRRAVPAIHALVAIGNRIGGSLLLGAWVPMEPGLVLGSLFGVGTLAAVAWLAARPGPSRTERLWCGAAFLLLLAAGLFRIQVALDALHEVRWPGWGSRYFVPPQIIATWLLAWLLVEGGRLRRRLVSGVLLTMLAVNLPRLREPELLDMQWERYAEQIRPGEPIVVPINPPVWTIELPAGW